MRHVLVVCTANQCRSPMAEGLLAHRARQGRLPMGVSSAGTWAVEDLPPTDHAVAVMAERGIDIAGIRSREVGGPLLEEADLVLVMTRGHLEAIGTEFPWARRKLMLLSGLAGGVWDVADPVGGTLADYRRTADELERLIDAGWLVIQGEAQTASPSG